MKAVLPEFRPTFSGRAKLAPLGEPKLAPEEPSGPRVTEALKPARSKRRARALAEAVIPSSLVVWRGPGILPHGRSRVAITFDDGPGSLTREYLAVLDRYGARATFFVVGELCKQRPELVRAIADAGHELAGHGYTHKRFPTLGHSALESELERTKTLLPKDGHKRALVRPPHGAISLRSTLTSATAGFTTVLWSYNSGDWATTDASEIRRTFEERPVESGDIVLFHEDQTWTLDALPRVLDGFQRAGHELVTVGELLGR